MTGHDDEVLAALRRDFHGGIDPYRPHTARIWDHWRHGKDNFPADQAAAAAGVDALAALPALVEVSHAFLVRAMAHIAGAGCGQFLDVGAGLPRPDQLNAHGLARRALTSSRTVYLEHEPLALAHLEALLPRWPETEVTVVDGDLREPGTWLPRLRDLLDLRRPVAVLAIDVLPELDDDSARRLLATLLDVLAPGSLLAATHLTGDRYPTAVTAAAAALNGPDQHVRPRSRTQVGALLGTWEVADPGIVPCGRWRPLPEQPPDPAPVLSYALLARVPGPITPTPPP